MWPVNKKIRVMVVDDSILARTMIAQGLAKHPRIEVVGTGFNATDAMAKVAQLKPDVITSDVEMPGMSGIETFEQMKDMGVRVPVIFLTASGLEDDVRSAIRLGAVNYLRKPCPPQELLKRIAQELETE